MRLARAETGSIHSMFLSIWNMTDEALAAAADGLREQVAAEPDLFKRMPIQMALLTFTDEIERRAKLKERANV